MSTSKLTLIIASLALALAWAVTASAANAAEVQTTGSAWCGGHQSGTHGPHAYGSNR